jgi:alpha-mannosidase
MNKIPLAYTFGNHMHWVDMQWLWGYNVLPGSTDDMLNYCRSAELKGGLNFDGIGYEKLASDSPEHLTAIKASLDAGQIEIVGGSYGQPYGLFHWGESNIRQRVYGVRTCLRLFGHRPTTFWEEEFDCFPQLPQMLAGTGFKGASLYFQWTWHTPEIPMEDVPVVRWESPDGTGLPTATRNRMNLHQWPEDFQILLDELAENPPDRKDDPESTPPPLVLQWLELMPTKDWMCRSELMLPMIDRLKSDPRFDLRPMLLRDYLELWKYQDLPARRFATDDVWHGMTLGKNNDRHPMISAQLELGLRAAETTFAILGLFGRPYKPWDVYPTWELEECWRQLLAAQHHDNHECEGLCGHVAESQFAYARQALYGGESSAIQVLARRLALEPGDTLQINPNDRPVRSTFGTRTPAFGWAIHEGLELEPEFEWAFEEDQVVVRSDQGFVTFHPESLRLAMNRDGEVAREFTIRLPGIDPEIHSSEIEVDGDVLTLEYAELNRYLDLRVLPETGDLQLSLVCEFDEGQSPEPGYQGALTVGFDFGEEDLNVRSDSPYHVGTVTAGVTGKRKYPEGDWMTSPQWFESVEGMFTAQSFVDVKTSTSGVTIAHEGHQQWIRTPTGVENVIFTLDPWDGQDQKPRQVGARYRISIHDGNRCNADCIRVAQQMAVELADELQTFEMHENRWLASGHRSDIPRRFSAVHVHNSNVLASAFYREQAAYARRGLQNYVALDTEHPYVLRLVECNGDEGEARVTVPGPIAAAFKTDFMGENGVALRMEPGESRVLTDQVDLLGKHRIEAVTLVVPMRPFEIATLYLDIVPGRKKYRDLDAKREIWATVHRVEEVS